MSEKIRKEGSVAVAREWGIVVDYSPVEQAIVAGLANTPQHTETERGESSFLGLEHPFLTALEKWREVDSNNNVTLSREIKSQAAIRSLLLAFGPSKDLLTRDAFTELGLIEGEIRERLASQAVNALELERRVRSFMLEELKRTLLKELKESEERLALLKKKDEQSKAIVQGSTAMSKIGSKNEKDYRTEIEQLRMKIVLIRDSVMSIYRSISMTERTNSSLAIVANQNTAPITAEKLMNM